MNFFEMIYYSGPEDFNSDFYKNNTEESRKDFFDQMLERAKREIDKINESDYVSAESCEWFTAHLKEKVDALNQMRDEFITNGQARFDSYVSLWVGERTLKDV